LNILCKKKNVSAGAQLQDKGNYNKDRAELILFKNILTDLYFVTELLSNSGRIPDAAGPVWPNPTLGPWNKGPPPNCY
jgi:hypothetical protein